MATNVRVYGASPRWPVDVTAGAHGSGDLAEENGKFGICVEANESGQPNTLLERGIFVLPVPSGVVAGQKLYTDHTYLGGPGGGAINDPPDNGSTIQPAPKRSVSVPSHLTTSNTGNTLIGTAVSPAYFDGLTQVAQIELAPQ